MIGLRRCLIAAVCLVTAWLCVINTTRVDGASLATAPDISWANPLNVKLNNTGPAANSDHSYTCTNATYRIAGDLSKTMRQGCFVIAAFGMYDPASSVLISTGTDEGEVIYSGESAAALLPLPYSGSVARFGGLPGVGSYMYFYSSLADRLENRMDPLNFTRYKRLTGTPDVTLTFNGSPLAVNTQAMAMSARSQWLVTESPEHSLVRVSMANFSVLPFAPSYSTPGNPYAIHNASMAITEDGRYAVAATNEFKHFMVYDLAGCSTANNTLEPTACPSHDYWNYIASQVTGSLSSVQNVHFIHDGLLAFNAVTSTGTDSYVLSPNGSPTALIPYLGLGDSFTSGQGAWNYMQGTDTATNACHLSLRSYPLRLSGAVFGSQGKSVACSGGRIHDVGSTSRDYRGQVKNGKTAAQHEADGSEVTILHDYVPGELAQQRFVGSYLPGVITVGIGGNDVGFKDMLLACVAPGDCYPNLEDRQEVVTLIQRQYPRWVSLFSQLRNESPQSRIYAIGYPQIVSLAGQCNLNARLSQSDIAVARDLTTVLNQVIARAARAAGVHYVAIDDALKGSELCSGARNLLAVNGVTAGSDALGILGQESYHPNAYGHELIADAILKSTHNFAPADQIEPLPNLGLPEIAADSPLLQAPAAGRTQRLITPLNDVPQSVVSGSVTTINIDGNQFNVVNNTTYNIYIGGQLVGSGNSDSSGQITGTVVPPSTVPAGPQPITIEGNNQQGAPAAGTGTTYVEANPDDYDGDGSNNNNDSCPTVENSNVDADFDGIDDACDTEVPLVVQPSQGSGTGETGSNSGTETSTNNSGDGNTDINNSQNSSNNGTHAIVQPATNNTPQNEAKSENIITAVNSTTKKVQAALGAVQSKEIAGRHASSVQVEPLKSRQSLQTSTEAKTTSSNGKLGHIYGHRPWLPIFPWWWLVVVTVGLITIKLLADRFTDTYKNYPIA